MSEIKIKDHLWILKIVLFIAITGNFMTALENPSLAIFNFQDASPETSREYQWLSKGIPQILSSDFSSFKRFRIISREEMHQLFQEIEYAETGIADQKNAVKAGKTAHADLGLFGQYAVQEGQITIEAHIIRISNEQIVSIASVKGETGRLSELIRDLAVALLKKMNMSVSEEDINKMLVVPIRTVKAMHYYALGKSQLKNSGYEDAWLSFRRALKADKTFLQATLGEAKAMLSMGSVKMAVASLHRIYSENPEHEVADDSIWVASDIIGNFLNDKRSAAGLLAGSAEMYPDGRLEHKIDLWGRISRYNYPENYPVYPILAYWKTSELYHKFLQKNATYKCRALEIILQRYFDPYTQKWRFEDKNLERILHPGRRIKDLKEYRKIQARISGYAPGMGLVTLTPEKPVYREDFNGYFVIERYARGVWHKAEEDIEMREMMSGANGPFKYIVNKNLRNKNRGRIDRAVNTLYLTTIPGNKFKRLRFKIQYAFPPLKDINSMKYYIGVKLKTFPGILDDLCFIDFEKYPWIKPAYGIRGYEFSSAESDSEVIMDGDVHTFKVEFDVPEEYPGGTLGFQICYYHKGIPQKYLKEWPKWYGWSAEAEFWPKKEITGTGNIDVSVNYSYADVWLDGVYIGKGPQSMRNVSAGEHYLRIERKKIKRAARGRVDWYGFSRRVLVENGSTARITFNRFPNETLTGEKIIHPLQLYMAKRRAGVKGCGFRDFSGNIRFINAEGSLYMQKVESDGFTLSDPEILPSPVTEPNQKIPAVSILPKANGTYLLSYFKKAFLSRDLIHWSRPVSLADRSLNCKIGKIIEIGNDIYAAYGMMFRGIADPKIIAVYGCVVKPRYVKPRNRTLTFPQYIKNVHDITPCRRSGDIWVTGGTRWSSSVYVSYTHPNGNVVFKLKGFGKRCESPQFFPRGLPYSSKTRYESDWKRDLFFASSDDGQLLIITSFQYGLRPQDYSLMYWKLCSDDRWIGPAVLKTWKMLSGKGMEGYNSRPKKTDLHIMQKTETPFANSIGIPMLSIPGCKSKGIAPFRISETEISCKQYKVFKPKHTCYCPEGLDKDKIPVTHVSRKDAEQFCKWLSKKEEKHYRLPTETEWEWAARAGTDARFPWGEGWPTLAMANYRDSLHRSDDDKCSIKCCGEYPGNAFGLRDVGGNVWEWVYNNFPGTDTYGITKGGCWESPASELACMVQRLKSADKGDKYTGFRVVCTDSKKSPSRAGDDEWKRKTVVKLPTGKEYARRFRTLKGKQVLRFSGVRSRKLFKTLPGTYDRQELKGIEVIKEGLKDNTILTRSKQDCDYLLNEASRLKQDEVLPLLLGDWKGRTATSKLLTVKIAERCGIYSVELAKKLVEDKFTAVRLAGIRYCTGTLLRRVKRNVVFQILSKLINDKSEYVKLEVGKVLSKDYLASLDIVKKGVDAGLRDKLLKGIHTIPVDNCTITYNKHGLEVLNIENRVIAKHPSECLEDRCFLIKGDYLYCFNCGQPNYNLEIFSMTKLPKLKLIKSCAVDIADIDCLVLKKDMLYMSTRLRRLKIYSLKQLEDPKEVFSLRTKRYTRIKYVDTERIKDKLFCSYRREIHIYDCADIRKIRLAAKIDLPDYGIHDYELFGDTFIILMQDNSVYIYKYMKKNKTWVHKKKLELGIKRQFNYNGKKYRVIFGKIKKSE